MNAVKASGKRPESPDGMVINFLLLCHEAPQKISRLIDCILSQDTSSNIVIHYDRNAPLANYESLRERYAHEPRCVFVVKRVRCAWGRFSLVEATLSMLHLCAERALNADYYYLISGSCYPVRPISELKQKLWEEYGTDYIEVAGPEWIGGGIREDRYLYHHLFNRQKHPKLSRYSYLIQRWLGLQRTLPSSISEIKFGSQWWCLSWQTVDGLLGYIRANYDVIRFFKTVSIPDECFFSTLVFIASSSDHYGERLTYTAFDNQGKAICLASTTVEGGFFFARKFS